MRPPLTPQQRKVLDAIIALECHGVAPGFRNIAAFVPGALGAIHRTCVHLKNKGYITWKPDQKRSIRVLGAIPDIADLEHCETSDLRVFAAQLAGLIAHRDGDADAAAMLRRIADRISHAPRSAA